MIANFFLFDGFHSQKNALDTAIFLFAVYIVLWVVSLYLFVCVCVRGRICATKMFELWHTQRNTF